MEYGYGERTVDYEKLSLRRLDGACQGLKESRRVIYGVG